MDLATIEPALVTWAAAVTGVEASCVVWENAPRPMTNGRLVTLSWVSIVGAGIDETSWAYEANADPLQEMIATVAGPRACVLQLAVEVIADQRPGHTARAVAETARTRMQGPTSLAALQAVKIGFAGTGLVTPADYTGDNGRKISRVVCEVRLNAESRVVDGTTSYIASVHATLNVDGLVTPTGYAPTEITAP
jgi:hypothetical protein